MSKLEKRIQKMIEKGKIFEGFKIIEKKLEQRKTPDYAEDFHLLSLILEHLNQDQDNIIHNILYYTEKNLDDSDWILRRNALEILKALATKFPKIFISRKYLSSIKKYATKDPHWQVRSTAIDIYGIMGEYVPERVLILLKEKLKDDDDDVRKTVIRYLQNIAEKNHYLIPEILPLLKRVQKSDVHWEIVKIAGNFIESLLNIQIPTQKSLTESQETFICPFCSKEYTKDLDICLNCGKDFPRCIICKEIIRIKFDSEIAYCPHCKVLAHPEHLQKWVLVNQNCPACMNPLNEKDIKKIKKTYRI